LEHIFSRTARNLSRYALRRVFIGSAAVKRQKSVSRLLMETGEIRKTRAICHPPCQAAQAGSLAHRYAEIKKGRLKPDFRFQTTFPSFGQIRNL
jgi:hypothetical protein